MSKFLPLLCVDLCMGQLFNLKRIFKASLAVSSLLHATKSKQTLECVWCVHSGTFTTAGKDSDSAWVVSVSLVPNSKYTWKQSFGIISVYTSLIYTFLSCVQFSCARICPPRTDIWWRLLFLIFTHLSLTQRSTQMVQFRSHLHSHPFKHTLTTSIFCPWCAHELKQWVERAHSLHRPCTGHVKYHLYELSLLLYDCILVSFLQLFIHSLCSFMFCVFKIAIEKPI